MENLRSLCVRIAGISARFNGLPKTEYEIMLRRYDGFIADSGDAVWDFEWGHVFGPETSWDIVLESLEDRWVFYRRDFKAEWFPAENRGVARIDSSEYTIDALIRVWFSAMLMGNNGGLFHSAGLVKDDRGYIFVGRSGKGKTTLSRKCERNEILSDELTAVRKTADGYMVYGTPFIGDLGVAGVNREAPLERFFIIDRTAPLGRTPVSRAVGASELWGTLMCFNRQSDFLNNAMNFCSGMAADLPCELFSFDISADHWRLLP